MVGAQKMKLPPNIRFFNHDTLSKKVSWLRHNHDISVVNHDIFDDLEKKSEFVHFFMKKEEKSKFVHYFENVMVDHGNVMVMTQP